MTTTKAAGDYISEIAKRLRAERALANEDELNSFTRQQAKGAVQVLERVLGELPSVLTDVENDAIEAREHARVMAETDYLRGLVGEAA